MVEPPQFELVAPGPDPLEAVAAAWNEGPGARGARACKLGALKPETRSKIKAAIRREGLQVVLAAIRRAADCPHLLGQNDRGWRADLLWLMTTGWERHSLERYEEGIPVQQQRPEDLYYGVPIGHLDPHERHEMVRCAMQAGRNKKVGAERVRAWLSEHGRTT